MSNYCFCVPILPGGAEKMRKWAKAEIPSPGHDEVFAAAGVTREQVWVQETPMGDFAVVSFEVADPAKAMKTFGESTHPWAERFRQFALDTHGVDFTQPTKLNLQAVNWDSKTTTIRAR